MGRHTRIVPIFLLASSFLACNRKPAPEKAKHHYALSGRIIAVNTKDQTATIAAAAIPNYMEAMTMEYPISSKDDFAKLHVGDKITATVDVRDDGLYSLSHINTVSSTQK